MTLAGGGNDVVNIDLIKGTPPPSDFKKISSQESTAFKLKEDQRGQSGLEHSD